VPVAQELHAELRADPRAVENFPAGQSMHDAACARLYFPVWHFEQERV
jgi:hypothetical protein